MTLQDKVPVEPIAPERLERLERRIAAAAGPVLARPRRPSFWPVGLALAGAAAGAIAMYALRPAPPAPTTPAIAVTTDGERGATLALGDTSIAAAPDTKYDVVRGGGGADARIDVRLDHGAVTLDVAPRKNRPPLWVHAGDVGVRVVGTAFTVTRAPEGDVSVEVEHGTVEVHQAGAVAPVTGGQRWSSRDGSVIAMAAEPATPDGATGADGSAGGGTGGAGGNGDATGDGRIGAGGTHTGDLATGPAIDVAVLGERNRPTVTPGSGTGTGSGSSRTSPRTGAKPGSGTGSGTSAADPDAATPGDLRSEIRRVPLAPGLSVDARSNVERETVLRTRFARGSSSDASAALYTLARFQFVELGKRADALKSLDQYETRFPKGAEREDAMWLRVRILCDGGFSNACRAAAHSYLKAFAKDVDLDLDAASATLRVRLANRVTKQP
jgi:hypothetical protein